MKYKRAWWILAAITVAIATLVGVVTVKVLGEFPPYAGPYNDWPLLIVTWTEADGTPRRIECNGIEKGRGRFDVFPICIHQAISKDALIEGQRIVRIEGNMVTTEYFLSDKVPPILDERRVLTYVKDGKATKCAGGLFMAKDDYRVIGCDLTSWQGAMLEGREIVYARDFGDGTYLARVE